MINDAVLYTRVSSDEQKKSGFSLPYQEKQGKEYAASKKLNIIKIFSESFTAKKPGRPEFNKMLEFCKKNKVRHLIFLKSDRASRNGVDSSMLVYMAEYEDYNIHLIQDCLTLNKRSKATDYLIFEISNCFSNFYPRNLSIDVSTKMREKAEQGHYPAIAPVGYKNVRTNRRSYIQINPEKAPFIRRIFELYSTGKYSYETLAKQMREENFMVSDCVKCGRTNIADILNNPIYMGDFIWKGVRYFNAKHEPIVSRELYAMCQKIIAEHSSSKTRKHEFIFSNLIKCAKCGCYLVGELKKGKYIYYRCTGNRSKECKKDSYVREHKVEEALLEIFKSFELPNDYIQLVSTCIKNEVETQNYFNEKRIKKLEQDIEKTKSRLNRLFNLYLDGQVPDEMYKNKMKELETELDEMNLRYSAYNKTSVEILKYSEMLFELSKNASRLYLRGNIQEKREIIKIVCSNFFYDGENFTITIKKAFQPLVEIASLEMVGRGGFEPP